MSICVPIRILLHILDYRSGALRHCMTCFDAAISDNNFPPYNTLARPVANILMDSSSVVSISDIRNLLNGIKRKPIREA